MDVNLIELKFELLSDAQAAIVAIYDHLRSVEHRSGEPMPDGALALLCVAEEKAALAERACGVRA